MPFFVVDDGAHSHPKMVRAGNAAVGLWSRIGSYVAQHLTDGHVPGPVAEMYGTGPQIRKLLAVGLWHEHGHTCPRCPQPREGDYFMHDYRESGNPCRAEVLARRERAAAKKRRQRGGGGTPPGGPRGPQQPRLDDDQDPPHEDPAPAPGRAEPAASRGAEPELIPAGWRPSPDDVAAAQAARAAAGRPPLTEQQLGAVTRKFVRHMHDKGTRAAGFGGAWQTWAERERPEPPGGGGEVVQFPGGRQTRGQQQRAGLARLLDQTTREV